MQHEFKKQIVYENPQHDAAAAAVVVVVVEIKCHKSSFNSRATSVIQPDSSRFSFTVIKLIPF
jgi:hypothetical protein